MKDKTPYNAGELRRVGSKNVIICGHIWWPIEQENAYHVLKVDEYGEPTSDNPEYIWDHSHGQWPVFVPKEKAA